MLEYEKYDAQANEETRNISSNPSPPPLDSSGSSVNSESTSSSHDEKPSGDDSDEGDSLDLVTCYCGKPFARRPMIECSRCLTWIHLSCARIKKTQIPEVRIQFFWKVGRKVLPSLINFSEERCKYILHSYLPF